MEDWKLMDSIELFKEVFSKSSSGVVDSTANSSLGLNIVTSKTTLRDEFICFTHGFLKHQTLCLFKAVIKGGEVSPESLYCRYGPGKAEGCF